MQHRRQRTIAREALVEGVALFCGADVRVRFRPAPENHGIAFCRSDLAERIVIPALIESVIPRPRRTAIGCRGTVVETIEHVMAALAGLQIDNCLIELNAPEPPAGDGSALLFVDALLETGVIEQSAPRICLNVTNKAHLFSLDGRVELSATAATDGMFSITYELDYGHPHLPRQRASVHISPRTFIDAVAFARTFVLQEEVAALQQQGYGLRMTPQNLLVFGPDGVVDNQLHTPDECARHKILDCVGDFALLGCDVVGHFHARRSGHRHNHELIRDLITAHPHIRTVRPSAA